MKEGWNKYNLMDICNVTTGKHDANHADEDGKYRFYTCSSQYVYCNTKRYKGECIILPGNGVNVGESYYYNGEFDAYQRTYVIDKIDKCIVPMFLYYHLQNNWKTEGVAKQYGSATNYIKIANFKDYIVNTPQTLDEQQSIVDYLDSAFAKIDAMKANAEKNLNEAKALFQASLKEMLEPKEGWEEKKLGYIGELKNGMNFNKNEYGYNVHILGVGDFGNLFQIKDTDSLQTISLNSKPTEEYILKNEDIVFVRSNGNKNLVGRCVLIHVGNEHCSFSGFCIRLRKTSNEIDACYLTHFLKTEDARKKLVGNGANISNLNQKVLNEFIVSYPSIQEQQNIVTTLDSLKSKVDRLQENLDKISQECDALKKAILRQVFE